MKPKTQSDPITYKTKPKLNCPIVVERDETMSKISRQTRRAFTLMELLLVMAILVIMASMVTYAFMNFQTNAQKDAALSQISTLKTACRMYKMQVGTFPTQLQDLIALPSGMDANRWRGPYLDSQAVPVDPWSNPYNYDPTASGNAETVVIVSAGPDRQLGTGDDVPQAGTIN